MKIKKIKHTKKQSKTKTKNDIMCYLFVPYYNIMQRQQWDLLKLEGS